MSLPMASIVQSSANNVSPIPGVSFTTKRSSFLTRCNIQRRLNKQTLPVLNYTVPLSTSIRLFPQFRNGCILNPKLRTRIVSASGTDVAVEEANVSQADSNADDAAETSAQSDVSSVKSKRARPARKSDVPPVKDEELIPGAAFTGKVRSIQPFGAFVDFGAFTDGLVHVSRLSDSFVKDVANVVTVGQEVTVRLIEANMETGRISLSMRDSDDPSKPQKQKDSPVNSGEKSRPPRKNDQRSNQKRDDSRKSSKFVKGQDLEGTVKNLNRAGAFVSLPEGEEGFLPTEEQGDEGFGNMMGESSLEIGQQVSVRVLRISRGRVTLTMKKEELVGELDAKLSQGVVHTATNPFVLAFRSNEVISAFLDEREKNEKAVKDTDAVVETTGDTSSETLEVSGSETGSIDAVEAKEDELSEIVADVSSETVEEVKDEVQVQESDSSVSSVPENEDQPQLSGEITDNVEEVTPEKEDDVPKENEEVTEISGEVAELSSAEDAVVEDESESQNPDTTVLSSPQEVIEDPPSVSEETSEPSVVQNEVVTPSESTESIESLSTESLVDMEVADNPDVNESETQTSAAALENGNISSSSGQSSDALSKETETKEDAVVEDESESQNPDTTVLSSPQEVIEDPPSVSEETSEPSVVQNEEVVTPSESTESIESLSTESLVDTEVVDNPDVNESETQTSAAAPENGNISSSSGQSSDALSKETETKAVISPALVKQLREETGAGMMDCKRALSETGGDVVKAQEYLRKKGLASADKKSSRVTAEGRIGSYIHDSRIGVLIEVNCETDFVARGDIFKELVEDLAMQVAACPQVQYLNSEDVPKEIVDKERDIEMQKEDLLSKPEQIRSKIVDGRIKKRLDELALLEQPFIRDDKVVVKDWVKQTISTIGENIKVKRFVRYNLGEGLEKKSLDFAAEVAAQTAAKLISAPVKEEPAAAAVADSEGPKEEAPKPVVSAALVKQLRDETGAGMMDCKKALSESGGDLVKAQEYLRKKGLSAADKKSSRLAAEGRIGSYIHDSRIGVLIEVNCETDFVGRGNNFKELVDDLAMQVAACPLVQYVSIEDIPADFVDKEKQLEMQKEDLQSKPEGIREKIVDGRVAKRLGELALLEQPFIKNDSLLVKDLVKQTVAALGENIKVRRFVRFTLGETVGESDEKSENEG